MKQQVKLAVTRLLGIQAEFTNQEILDAIEYIRENELDKIFDRSSQLARLRRPKDSRNDSRVERSSTPRVIVNLQETAPEKYDLLLEIDKGIRSGQVLTKIDEIRRLGTSIDKNFDPGKSHKDAVARIFSLLSGLPLPELKAISTEIRTESANRLRNDDAYRNLATFLIKGGNKTDEK